MNHSLLLAFAIGFVTASPVGPIGLLCLRRTLARGVMTGLVSALGIACAYAFWSYVAVHGLAAASGWIEQQEALLEVIIGVFFVLYGLHAVFNTPSTDYPTLQRRGGLAEFLSTFLVVFLNPATFILFSALFTVFGIARHDHALVESLEIALAVCAGALLFWLVVTQVVQRARAHIHDTSFSRVAHLSSFAIVLFGLAILLHCLYDYLHTGN